MQAPRAYVDTSVFGGILDDQFAEASKRFFEQVQQGAYIVLVSRETLRELGAAPADAQEILNSIPDTSVEFLVETQEAVDLAEAYIKAGVLGRASQSDALHIAVATLAHANLILSWNFRHIVNYNRIRGFNAVNMRLGYGAMAIHSPMEVVFDDRS